MYAIRSYYVEPAIVDFGDLPGEEGENFVKGEEAIYVGRSRLIHGAVAPADIHGLLGDPHFAGVTETIAVIVVEHPVLLAGEPLKDP